VCKAAHNYSIKTIVHLVEIGVLTFLPTLKFEYNKVKHNYDWFKWRVYFESNPEEKKKAILYIPDIRTQEMKVDFKKRIVRDNARIFYQSECVGRPS
jgi:hypothetical protein